LGAGSSTAITAAVPAVSKDPGLATIVGMRDAILVRAQWCVIENKEQIRSEAMSAVSKDPGLATIVGMRDAILVRARWCACTH
jgi:hypothetical protein